jgi:hypothetical protein
MSPLSAEHGDACRHSRRGPKDHITSRPCTLHHSISMVRCHVPPIQVSGCLVGFSGAGRLTISAQLPQTLSPQRLTRCSMGPLDLPAVRGRSPLSPAGRVEPGFILGKPLVTGSALVAVPLAHDSWCCPLWGRYRGRCLLWLVVYAVTVSCGGGIHRIGGWLL